MERGTAILHRYRADAEAMQRLAEELANIAEDAVDLRDSGSAELEEIAERLRASAVAGGEFSSSLDDPSQLEELLGKAVDSAAAESQPYYEALREEEAVTDKLKQEDRLAVKVPLLYGSG